MKIITRNIGRDYQEVKVEGGIESGTMNKDQSIEFARMLLDVAEDLLYGVGRRHESDMCGEIIEELLE